MTLYSPQMEIEQITDEKNELSPDDTADNSLRSHNLDSRFLSIDNLIDDSLQIESESIDVLFNQNISSIDKLAENNTHQDLEHTDDLIKREEEKQNIFKECDKFVENEVEMDVDRAYLERFVKCPISTTMKSLNHEKLANISKYEENNKYSKSTSDFITKQ